MRILHGLVAILLLALPSVAGGGATSHRWVRDPELQARIDRTIEAGIAYLRTKQVSDGRWTYSNQPLGRVAGGALARGTPPSPPAPPSSHRRRRAVANPPTQEKDAGLTALALYALATAGVPPEDKTVQNGLLWASEHPTAYDKGSGVGTYSISLLILALTRIDPVEHGSSIRLLADRLAKAQSSHGKWSYRLRAPRPTSFPRVGGRGVHAGDNSNTQYAVLALWAAHSLAGHNAARGVWGRVGKHFKTSQNRDGSWSYRTPASRTGRRTQPLPGTSTMTAAGLVSYVYAAAAVNPKDSYLQRTRASPISSRGMDAFRYLLSKRLDWSDLQLACSIERVATVHALRDHSWYEKGALAICDGQDKHGLWIDSTSRGDSRHVYATSLALLFLTRATLPPHRGVITPPARLDVLTASERAPLLQTAKSHQRAFEIYISLPAATRAGDARVLGARGKEFIDLLVRAIRTEPREKARAAAHELLQVLLGKRFLYDAGASEADRKVMAQPIGALWQRMRPKAVWDARAGHYVGPA